MGRIVMTTYHTDPRMGAKALAGRLPPLSLGKRFLEDARNELLGVSRCVSVVVARSRIRALRTRARRAGESALVNDLDLLLTKSAVPTAPEYECVFCGGHAVRCLRNSPYLSVCETHSVAGNRARDLRAIHRVLLAPPDEFFDALAGPPLSAILLSLESESSNIETMRHRWLHLLSEQQITPEAPAERVLAFWGACCAAYPETWETPPPITSLLWSVVSAESVARDAMASAQNGQQGGRPRDERQEKAIARLAARGLTQKAIAAKLGTAQCQVSRALRRLRAS